MVISVPIRLEPKQYTGPGIRKKEIGKKSRLVHAAGGRVKPGLTFGETDDFSYNIVKDPVSGCCYPATPKEYLRKFAKLHVFDLQATILNQLGLDHERLTYKYQGRHFRLTDVHGDVRKELLA